MLSRRRFLATSLAAGAGLLLGCGGGPPRKPTPPNTRDDSLRREKFMIVDVRDEWFEAPPIIDGLKRMGGVVDCYQDQTDGKFVVVYNPQRTHRDAIHQKLIEVGQDQGREFDVIFDDR